MKNYLKKRIVVNGCRFIMTLSLIVFLAGCKKDKQAAAPPQNEGNKKMSRMELNGTVVGTFAYDAEGRLTEYGTPTSKTVYDFSGNSFAYKWYLNNELRWEGKNAILNNGRLSSLYNQAYLNGAPSGNNINSFTYNPDGTLQSYGVVNDLYEYSYSNGDFIKATHKNNNALKGTNTYEYYTALSNKFNLPIMEFFFEFPYLTNTLVGSRNKHLIKKVTQANGANTYITEFTYELDAMGYVRNYTQVYTKNNGTPVTSVIHFFY